MKVSVIVPIYNTEKYLRRCIDSILAQTYTDFELILIDDGSTDNSGKICDEYAKINSRIHVIHKQNCGVSSARNVGIDTAKGEYIAFVDADDFVDKNYLSALALQSADMIVCSAWYADSDGNVTKKALDLKDEHHFVSDENILLWFEQATLYSVWGRLLKLSIIRENRLYFDKNTTRGEDTIFIFNYIEKCHEVIFISQPLYTYVRYGENGSSSTRLNKENVKALNNLDCFIADWLKAHHLQSDWFNKINYWTKGEQKMYFLKIYSDKSLSFIERYKWYRLFFSMSNFTDNIEVFFSNDSKKFLYLMKLKSPLILSLIQTLFL